MRRFFVALLAALVLTPAELVVAQAATSQTPSLRGESVDEQLPLHRQLDDDPNHRIHHAACVNFLIEGGRIIEPTEYIRRTVTDATRMKHTFCAEYCRQGGVISTPWVGIANGDTCFCMTDFNLDDMVEAYGGRIDVKKCNSRCPADPTEDTKKEYGGAYRKLEVFSVPKNFEGIIARKCHGLFDHICNERQEVCKYDDDGGFGCAWVKLVDL